MDIKDLRNRIERKKGRKLQIEESIKELKISLREKKNSLILHEKALEIVKIISIETQKQLQFHVEDITSLALESVFPNPYKLVIDIVPKKNKTQCELYFERNGNRVDPLTASGVGAVDISTFALRIAAWSMLDPQPNNSILLDEPFRCLSEDYQVQASEMMKEISIKLGIQFIIITHEEVLTEAADKIFKVRIKNEMTKIYPQ